MVMKRRQGKAGRPRAPWRWVCSTGGRLSWLGCGVTLTAVRTLASRHSLSSILLVDQVGTSCCACCVLYTVPAVSYAVLLSLLCRVRGAAVPISTACQPLDCLLGACLSCLHLSCDCLLYLLCDCLLCMLRLLCLTCDCLLRKLRQSLLGLLTECS